MDWAGLGAVERMESSYQCFSHLFTRLPTTESDRKYMMSHRLTGPVLIDRDHNN